MKNLFIPVLLIMLVSSLFANPNEEFRATWIISWDLVKEGNDVAANKALCRAIMDRHAKANMNAVLWQARQSGTAYYDSDIEPWGYYTGNSYPGYDIFEYAVQEAHRRGLEMHAWINIFHCSSTVPGAPAAEHPEWVCTNEDGEFMTKYRCLSPGLAPVREYLVKVVMEVVRKYDIDGIHFDFVRWNEYDEDDMQAALSKEAEHPALDGFASDDRIQRLNSMPSKRYIYDVEHPASGGIPDGFQSWDDWRRWTVTEFVRTAHDSIKSVKPWVRLSVAALGKYNWSGWQAYGTVYQDAALWFNEGYIDQLTPMHYHWLSGYDFYVMLAGPNGDSNYSQCWGKYIQEGINDGRLYTSGPGSYRLAEENVWDNHVDVVKKIREIDWIDGYQFFSYINWYGYDYWEEAKEKFFPTITKIRATGLIDDTPPDAPSIELTKLDTSIYRISVTQAGTGEVPSRYAVYRSKDSTFDAATDKIVGVNFGEGTYHLHDYIDDRDGGYFFYAATAFDRYWNESGFSNVGKTDSIPEKSITPAGVTLHYVRKVTDGYEVSWIPSGQQDAKGYRIYGKSVDADWQLLLDESTLDERSTMAIVHPGENDGSWMITVRAVGLGPKNFESIDPDIYGIGTSGEKRVLVVDAFDRITGQWKESTHPFARRVCESLGRLNVSFDCGTDDAVEDKDLALTDYDAVIWLAGDASGSDPVAGFNAISYLAQYLKGGGQLLMSGSEIGYDLDYKGSYQDKRFVKDCLKLSYVSNGGNGNGYKTYGQDGSIFADATFDFDNGNYGFRVAFPDIYETIDGSIPCLKYRSGQGIGGVQYEGTVSNGNEIARVITLGFPCEAIYKEIQLDIFMERVMQFFDILSTIDVSSPVTKAEGFQLFENYPNPFNAGTTFQFSLAKPARVEIAIYNIVGQKIDTISGTYAIAGLKRMQWTPEKQSSGIYYYSIAVNGHSRSAGKMVYLK